MLTYGFAADLAARLRGPVGPRGGRGVPGPEGSRSRRRPHEHRDPSPAPRGRRLRRRADPPGFPDPLPPRPRKAPRLPRQRGDDAEAVARSSRRRSRFYEQSYANIHRGVHTSRSRRATPTRWRGRRRGRSSTPRSRARSSSCAGTTEGINLVAQTYGRVEGRTRATRSSSPPSSTTPTSCPGRSCARRRARSSRVAPIDERGRDPPGRAGEALSERTTHPWPSAHISNALGTVNPVRPDRRDGARARRAGPRGRRAGGAADPGGRAGAGLRTSTRSPGTRCTRPTGRRRPLRESEAPRGDAAVPGWRRHDQLRHLREDDLQHPSLQVRGGDRPTSPAGSASAAAMDYVAVDRHRTRSRRTRTTSLSYATERLSAIPGLRDHRHGGEQGGGPLLHARGSPPARRRHGPRPRGHRRPHRTTTARSR